MNIKALEEMENSRSQRGQFPFDFRNAVSQSFRFIIAVCTAVYVA